MENEIMTVKEVANFLKVKPRQIYEYINRPKNPLPAINITHVTKRVSRQALLAWLEESKI